MAMFVRSGLHRVAAIPVVRNAAPKEAKRLSRPIISRVFEKVSSRHISTKTREFIVSQIREKGAVVLGPETDLFKEFHRSFPIDDLGPHMLWRIPHKFDYTLRRQTGMMECRTPLSSTFGPDGSIHLNDDKKQLNKREVVPLSALPDGAVNVLEKTAAVMKYFMNETTTFPGIVTNRIYTWPRVLEPHKDGNAVGMVACLDYRGLDGKLVVYGENLNPIAQLRGKGIMFFNQNKTFHSADIHFCDGYGWHKNNVNEVYRFIVSYQLGVLGTAS